jgi:CPA1 family monovalent cation:H+ antiporter
MLTDSARLIEATRSGGRTAYRATARANAAHGRAFRLSERLHRLGISGPLGNLVAARFEVILITRMILRDLHDFVDERILRIHGRRLTDILHEVLARREEELDREIEGLRLQYPGYADELERSFIRRTRVRLEEREIEASLDDGLIGVELYQSLMRGVNARRREAEMRPRLDLWLQKREIVAQFPLFADLEEGQRRRLARAFVTIYAEPGDVIIRRGEQVGSVYFIASGAVEREVAGMQQRLGRGELFGEIALLAGQRVRRGRVRAITHCTLLRLDEARFLRLLRRLPELRARAVAAAAEQGADPARIEARILAA